ncbi:MAG: HigA family addiction module antidote protein [Truepera sp.]|nr:HigA family addiction module antidote protein [Truepera sp.]
MRDIPPIHPGAHLAEYLAEYGLSQYALAKATSMSEMRISEIVRGKRAITADTALRLGRFFGVAPEFWLNLQSRYDLEVAAEALGPALEHEVAVHRPNA